MAASTNYKNFLPCVVHYLAQINYVLHVTPDIEENRKNEIAMRINTLWAQCVRAKFRKPSVVVEEPGFLYTLYQECCPDQGRFIDRRILPRLIKHVELKPGFIQEASYFTELLATEKNNPYFPTDLPFPNKAETGLDKTFKSIKIKYKDEELSLKEFLSKMIESHFIISGIILTPGSKTITDEFLADVLDPHYPGWKTKTLVELITQTRNSDWETENYNTKQLIRVFRRHTDLNELHLIPESKSYLSMTEHLSYAFSAIPEEVFNQIQFAT